MSGRRRWSIPLVLLAAGTLLVWLAPAERTLGEGIRWVYVHVGLVWAGALALAIASCGGIAVAVSGRADLEGWVWAAWQAGLAAFTLGVVFSLIAARINWGAIVLAEPRMAASLRFLALAAIIQVLASWGATPRLTGVLAVATFGLLVWQVGGAELVLHPRDPVRTATSRAIQWTFAGSFAIATALTFWTTLALLPRAGRAE